MWLVFSSCYISISASHSHFGLQIPLIFLVGLDSRSERKKKSRMGRNDYLAMKTDPATQDLINSDIDELKIAAKRLINHATKLGGLSFGTSFLKWVASFAAMWVLSFYIFRFLILVLFFYLYRCLVVIDFIFSVFGCEYIKSCVVMHRDGKVTLTIFFFFFLWMEYSHVESANFIDFQLKFLRLIFTFVDFLIVKVKLCSV